MLKKGLVIALLVFTAMQLKSQDTISNNSFSLNADLVSRYVWRGQLYNTALNIQPYAAFTKGQFTIGTWGSYAIGEQYSEIDFYVTWEYKNLSLSVYDYCTLNEGADGVLQEKTKFFSFEYETTPHAAEGVATFQVSESFPLKLTAATFFYGNDRDDSGNLYSTYFELSYPFSASGYDFNAFAGGTTTDAGYYGDEAGMVNIGLSATKTIKVSDSFEIPAAAQLIANPVADCVYLVFSLTF